MEWRLAGQDHTVVIEYIVGGQPVVPDAGTVSFKAWDHAADLVKDESYTPDPGVPPTQLEVLLDSTFNTIDSAAVFEARYVRVDFEWNSKPYFTLKNYRLHRMIPMIVTAENVRSLIGADIEEIRDEEIDLVGAYFALSSSTSFSINSALLSPTLLNIAANEAIALLAALNFLPSLQTRLLKLEKSEASGYERSTIDFEQLKADLTAKYNARIAEVTTGTGGTALTAEVPTLFIVTKQTDPVTGT